MGQRAECKRAVLKLSGNALCPPERAGFDEESLTYAASELKSAQEACGELAVVLGGGNLMRGATVSEQGVRRIRADRCGMLATISNAIMFQDHLERAGISVDQGLLMRAPAFCRKSSVPYLSREWLIPSKWSVAFQSSRRGKSFSLPLERGSHSLRPTRPLPCGRSR